MTKYILQAANRIVFGRKVKKLRGGGILPANIYGKKIKSHAVSVKSTDFLDIFKNAGGSGIVELHLDGKRMPVLIHNISYHPVTGAPLHADFYNVDLKEKVTANIPLELVGESPAVKDKTGVLLTILNELEVEALPQDLPERITVDIKGLKTVDEAVKIKDLKISPNIRIINDSELEVVKIAPLVSKEAQNLIEQKAQEEKTAAEKAAESEQAPVEEAPAVKTAQENNKSPQENK